MASLQLDTKTATALREKLRRQTVPVQLFRPLRHEDPQRSQEELIKCLEPRQVLVCAANRGGKSTLMAIKASAMALDKDVILRDGTRVTQRREDQKGRPLLMWLIGLDLKHIGQTVYPLLFKPGLFKVIRDKKTGLLRAFDPTSPEDVARESDVEDSPPVIPPWEVKRETWYNKAAHELKEVELNNGTVIRAYASTQEAKQGDKVDAIWIDEKIENPEDYKEWLVRLIDKRGRIFWSVYPALSSNDALVNLYEAADRMAAQEHPTVVRFTFRMSDNPFLPQKSRQEILESGMFDEESLMARDEGVLMVDQRRLYPLFSRRSNSLLAINENDDDALGAEVRKCGDIPPDWTRYLILDPGTTHPAIVAAAVPPPRFGYHVVFYDEIVVPRIDADRQADLAAKKFKNQRFQAFIIDNHAARQKPMSFNITVCANINRAFAQRGLRCEESGSRFTPGSDDVQGRIAILQSWMTQRHTHGPVLRIWLQRCPKLTDQILLRRKKLDKNGRLTEDPDDQQVHDAVDCAEYLASRKPKYVAKVEIPDFDNLLESLAKFRRKPAPRHINCGPGKHAS